MNFLTKREHDKFSEKTTTKTIPFSWGGVDFIFQHVSEQGGENLCIEVHSREYDLLHLEDGELIININSTKNIKLKPIKGLYTNKYEIVISKWEETAFYKITKEQLVLICKAKSIEYCLKGSHESKQCADYDEDGESCVSIHGDVIIDGEEYYASIDNSKIQYGAKALYNAIYDNTAYNRELQKIKKDILKDDEEYKEYEKEEKIKKQKKDKKNRAIGFWMRFFGIVLCIGGLASTVWGLAGGDVLGLLGFFGVILGAVIFGCSFLPME